MFAPLGFLPGVTKEQIAAIARRGRRSKKEAVPGGTASYVKR